MDRRICFQQSDDILEIVVEGRGLKTPPARHNHLHEHKEGRKASEALNRINTINAIQAAWNLSYDTGTCGAEDLPDRELIAKFADGHEDFFAPLPITGRATVAKGAWILDSGASDHLVGK
eukprot:2958865-Heterocapsa_arctica.AAC.1